MSKDHNIIYKTTNKINNKYYIGVHSTNNINDGYLGSGKVLKQALEKYGKDNFERKILYDFETYKEALNKEEELITEEMINESFCYNIHEGGNMPPISSGKNNGFYGKNHSKEQIEKWKNDRGGENSHLYGKTWEERFGVERAKEIKKIISDAKSGKNHHMYGINPDDHPSSKRCEHIPTGKIFKSGRTASKWAGLKYETFIMRIKRNSSNNEFKFLD